MLYPLAAVSFFMFYWADKYLILRSYRKPPNYDNTIALTLLGWFNYALIGHFVVSIWMYSNTKIFTCNTLEMSVSFFHLDYNHHNPIAF